MSIISLPVNTNRRKDRWFSFEKTCTFIYISESDGIIVDPADCDFHFFLVDTAFSDRSGGYDFGDVPVFFNPMGLQPAK